MLLPQEIEVWYVVPAIRKEIVLSLLARGYKKREIARILNITEAAVSQYAKNKRASKINFSKKIKQEIKKASLRIAKGCCVNKEIQKLCFLIRKTKELCKIHKSLEPVTCNCKVC